MSQLNTVFRFELKTYLSRKSYVALTLALMVGIAVVLSWPRISQSLFGAGGGDSANVAEVVHIVLLDATGGEAGDAAFYNDTLGEMGYAFAAFEGDDAEARAQVESGLYTEAVVLTSPLRYQRLVRNISMYDAFDSVFAEAMSARYRQSALEDYGLSASEASLLLSAQAEGETISVGEGKDQIRNFFYTYILIFLLYFAIIMYGQFIASSVATEKSTRAMELLITATRPTGLMFGKVLGAGLSGLLQLALVLGSGYLFYNLNTIYYADNFIVQSIFAMPLSMLLYTLLFFVLGFFLYAFLYAALASLVSRMEDLSTATMPVTFLFIAAFLIVMFSMGSGNVDSGLMLFASFFPLTSPMAMFTRIAMVDVSAWQVLLSVGLLIGTTIAIGVLAAHIYRLGVLLYGTPPKPAEIVKMLRANRR